uniref:Uncharacterized protein n=1 Tax=Anguilla anguilla TaxID=7936 RepID=A0A0E9S175_ANGAN
MEDHTHCLHKAN